MKKVLLFAAVFGITLGVTAQKSPAKLKSNVPTSSLRIANYDDVDLVKTPSVVSAITRPSVKGTSEISVLNLGNSANAFGLYNGGRTAVWADPNLNTIAFSHRMLATPGSGFVAIDYSKDAGSTWTVNQQVFNPTAGGTGIAPARYPQGLIYNPAGNTVPDNAFVTTFSATLDGSNASDSWGGYGTSCVKLDGTGLVQSGLTSHPPIRQNVPEAMTINPVTGDIFVVDPSLVTGLGNQYVDTLIITRGVFNATTNAYDYEQSLLYAPVNAYGTAIADTRIAFAPDGLTGYIMTLSDNGLDPMATTLAYYPILYKTTDGGLTWDDSPITVSLGGPDGIFGIINGLLTDDQIGLLFEPPLPARDEIVYTTAFTSDFAVDAHGNPVISVVIGVAGSDPYSISSAAGFFASYNLFSNDQGAHWLGQKLGDNLVAFRGEWGDVSEDNRSQVTTTYDGTKMFFSWLDTHFEGVTDNLQPDIFCVGWDIATNNYTEVVNVTYLSDAWLQAFMGTASYYSLAPAAGTYEIPFVYQAMDVIDPGKPVQYKYIKGFSFTDADFTIPSVKNIEPSLSSISQNFPNPTNGMSQVNVNLKKAANVSLDVCNIMGQRVFEIPSAKLSEGNHILTINASNLSAGIYTYSVIVNGERSTRKMIVE